MARPQKRPSSLQVLFRTKKRWCKYTGSKMLPDGTKAFCLLGGASFVYGSNTPQKARVVAKLLAEIQRRCGSMSSVVTYNDAPGRRHAQILNLVRAAKV